jgi:hypothetical protein
MDASVACSPTVVAAVSGLAWFVAGVGAGAVAAKRRAGGAAPAGARGRDRVEIYVGNLPYELTGKDLSRMFGEFGPVLSARVIKNRFNGKSKGYGFMEMSDRGQAAAAIRALNGKDVKGRKMVVNEAKTASRPKQGAERGDI